MWSGEMDSKADDGDSRFASRKVWESVAAKSGEGIAAEEAERWRGEQESRVGGSIRGSRRCDFIKTMYPEGAFKAHLDTQRIVINCADRISRGMHFVKETSGCVRESVKPAGESQERQRCCNRGKGEGGKLGSG
jgi:hypothetical protein